MPVALDNISKSEPMLTHEEMNIAKGATMLTISIFVACLLALMTFSQPKIRLWKNILYFLIMAINEVASILPALAYIVTQEKLIAKENFLEFNDAKDIVKFFAILDIFTFDRFYKNDNFLSNTVNRTYVCIYILSFVFFTPKLLYQIYKNDGERTTSLVFLGIQLGEYGIKIALFITCGCSQAFYYSKLIVSAGTILSALLLKYLNEYKSQCAKADNNKQASLTKIRRGGIYTPYELNVLDGVQYHI